MTVETVDFKDRVDFHRVSNARVIFKDLARETDFCTRAEELANRRPTETKFVDFTKSTDKIERLYRIASDEGKLLTATYFWHPLNKKIRFSLAWVEEQDPNAICQIGIEPLWRKNDNWALETSANRLRIDSYGEGGLKGITSYHRKDDAGARAQVLWEIGMDSRLRDFHMGLLDQFLNLFEEPQS